MPILHNKINNKELKEKLYQENFRRITISFYKYVAIENVQAYRDELYKNLNEMQVFGRIYIAEEGINAQISVPEFSLESFKNYINSIPTLNTVRLNYAVDDDGKSFWVLSIKIRNKIVADGIDDPNFSVENKGQYVQAKQLNEWINNPETIIVDMRNHYEYEVGHFKNAIEIPADTFKEQLKMSVEILQDKKDKNIVMYCTGGIRCEKASSYLKFNGFNNVFHLEGGIIKYAHEIKEQNIPSAFIGKNFVFDNRLGERITNDIIAHCHQCNKPCDNHINCKNEGCHLLFIQCAECALKYAQCCSVKCMEIYQLPIEQRKTLRKNINLGRNIFNKSRKRMQDIFIAKNINLT